jgi:hypothetical protein
VKNCQYATTWEDRRRLQASLKTALDLWRHI